MWRFVPRFRPIQRGSFADGLETKPSIAPAPRLSPAGMAAHAIFCLQRRAKPRSLSAQAMTRRAQAARVQGNGPGGRAVVRDRCCSIPSAVIVTGGARGLGRAMTLGLAKAGIGVAVADLPSSQAEIGELVALARTQGLADKIHAIDCDVTRWEDCRAAVEKAATKFGAVHGLVNNAERHAAHRPRACRRARNSTRSMPTPGAGASTSTSTDRS